MGNVLFVNRDPKRPVHHLDTFVLEGVNSINPVSYQDTGLQTLFVVIDEPEDQAKLNIWPPIITKGHFQNVTASPVNGSVVHFDGERSVEHGQTE